MIMRLYYFLSSLFIYPNIHISHLNTLYFVLITIYPELRSIKNIGNDGLDTTF